MKLDELLTALLGSVSGERARRYALSIAQYHRIQASSGYDEALDSIRRILEEAGLRTCVSEYPADGVARTHAWTAPVGWEISGAELWQCAPARRCLGTFQEDPLLVCTRSPGGITEGELVDVEAGTSDKDYEGKDVEGCFVLASGPPMSVVRQAARRGAVAALIYPGAERARASQDLRSYLSLHPTAAEIDQLIPGFSISRWCAEQLRGTLASQPVRLRGEVEAHFTRRPLRVLEATVEGTRASRWQSLLVAHLCHPRESANDNASGSGVLVELACQLQRLRDEVPFAQSLRFVWVPEFSGTLPWTQEHAAVLDDALVAVNLDMVGESPEIIGEPLRVYRIPTAIPTFLNACVEPLLQRVAERSRAMSPVMVRRGDPTSAILPRGSTRPLHWSFDLPAAGSDHLAFMAPPLRIPSFMIAHEDPYWHTDLDTTEKIDPARLRQVAIFAAALALLPSWTEDELPRLWNWTIRYCVQEAMEANELALDLEEGQGAKLTDAADRVGAQRIESLRRYLKTSGLHSCACDVSLLEAVRPEVRVQTREQAFEGRPERSSPRPVRQLEGPLSSWFMEDVEAEDSAFLSRVFATDGRPMTEFLLELCDGERTVENIAWQLSLDLGHVVRVPDVERALTLLEAAGYLLVR